MCKKVSNCEETWGEYLYEYKILMYFLNSHGLYLYTCNSKSNDEWKLFHICKNIILIKHNISFDLM